MAGQRRIMTMVAAAIFLLGVVAAIPSVGNAAEGNTVVTGIVEYAQGDVVTVDGKTYDLKGARFQDGHGAPLEQSVRSPGEDRRNSLQERKGRVRNRLPDVAAIIRENP